MKEQVHDENQSEGNQRLMDEGTRTPSGAPAEPEAPEGVPPKINVRDKRRVRPDDDAPVAPDVANVEEMKVDEMTKAKREAASYLEDLQRLKAEFENYRKRVLREQTEIVERASVGLIHRMLIVLDNFELAVAAAEESRDFDRMLKGVEMVFGELKEVLRAEGLQPIEAKGRHFDPNLHEAALEVAGEGDEPVVAEVLRPGYMFKGRVLRPAMVKVARARSENGGRGETK